MSKNLVNNVRQSFWEIHFTTFRRKKHATLSLQSYQSRRCKSNSSDTTHWYKNLLSEPYIAATARASPAGSAFAQQFSPAGGTVSGDEALQAAWQAGLDNGVRSVSIETQEVEQEGVLGYESGTYAILDPQGVVFESGPYLIVWRLENGQWKWHRHIWTPQFRAG